MPKRKPARRAAKRKRPSASESPPRPAEPRSGEALTVLWMLTILATLVAEMAAAAAAAWAYGRPGPAEGPSMPATLANVMLFTALVTGGLCLLLTPVVRRIRREPPPASVIWSAVAIGASPFFVLTLLTVGRVAG